jgi:hypothetical protein
MKPDPEYLRQHYASLSDEALRDINADELVPAARQCFEAEVKQRQLDSPVDVLEEYEAEEILAEEYSESDGDGPPDWLEDGAEIYSAVVRPGVAIAPGAANARDALEAAGIPCHLEICEDEPDEAPPEPTQRWRLMVPGNLNLRATGILQRDIFNDEFEAGWRTHLEVMSDQEVRAMHPRVAFCGLFDQIERATRAYEEELSRRR